MATLFAEEGVKKKDVLEGIDLGERELVGFSGEDLRRVRVDISFDDNSKASRLQSNCMMSSNYATRVVASDPRVRLLIILLKKILHMNGLNSSYLGKTR